MSPTSAETWLFYSEVKLQVLKVHMFCAAYQAFLRKIPHWPAGLVMLSLISRIVPSGIISNEDRLNEYG